MERGAYVFDALGAHPPVILPELLEVLVPVALPAAAEAVLRRHTGHRRRPRHPRRGHRHRLRHEAGRGGLQAEGRAKADGSPNHSFVQIINVQQCDVPIAFFFLVD